MPDGSLPPALRRIRGSGGAPKAAAAPHEAENTLRSRTVARVLYLISEGPIKGFVDSDFRKSVFFTESQTPVRASDGSDNFNVVAEYRLGDAGQTHLEGWPTSEIGVTGPGRVTASGTPAVRSIDLTGRDRLRFSLSVPSLYLADDQGSIDPNKVEFRIDWRPTGTSSWTAWLSDTIRGKCVAPYPKSYTGPAPHDGVIDVRVVRTSADPANSKDSSFLDWNSVSAILDQKLSYPGCAYVGIVFDAENFNGQVPITTFEVDGLICEVPTNYDPVTRVYSGLWDGTFKRAWTDSPAWIFWTLATDPTFGAGRALAAGLVSPSAAYAAAATLVDRWTLYSISQYCDELVADGFGGYEPRYRFNAWINNADEAYRVLQGIASSFRAMLYWGGGQVVPVADRPGNPVKLVTPANVVGDFLYESSALRSRHSLVRVRWRDPNLDYRETIEVVDDPVMMREVGIRTIDYEAVGCTSRSQARRMGRWVLFSERYEDAMVRYTAATDHANLAPGDLIQIQDPKLAGVAYSGRLAKTPPSTSQVQLDRAVTLNSGATYALKVVYPSGQISAAIPVTTGAGTTDTLSLGSAMAEVPLPEAVWLLVSSQVAPTTWRVVHVKESTEDQQWEITAARHYSGKYDAIENGWTLQDDPFTTLAVPSGVLAPPSNLTTDEYVAGSATTSLFRVVLSWTQSNDVRVAGYEAQAIRNGVVFQAQSVPGSSVEFPELPGGNYIFQVRATGRDGEASVFVATAETLVDGRADGPQPPTGLTASAGIRNNVVRWTNPTSRFLRGVQVWASSNSTFSAGGLVGESRFGEFVHTGLAALQAWYYWIRAIDNYGQTTGWVGPVSATTNQLLTADLQDAIINTAKFATGIEPLTLASSTPSTKSTNVIFNTTTKKQQRWDGTAYVNTIEAVDVTGTLTDSQIAGLAAAKLTGQITTTQISDNAISTPKIAAGAVVAGSIAAGAITTTKLSVGGGNVIYNSCFINADTKGWTSGGTATGISIAANSSAYTLRGLGTGFLTAPTVLPTGGYFYSFWDPKLNGSFVAASPGSRWQASCLMQAQRCLGRLDIVFFDASNNYLGEANSSTTTYGSAGGAEESQYALVTVLGTAPASTVFVVLRVIGLGNGSTGAASYVFWTKALLGLAPANATEVAPWEPGGITQISGGSILVGSLDADRIKANSIQAAQIAADTITAGQIAAGAIGASEIAANQINGTHIAATELISLSAQIGTLTVERIHVISGAITGTASASASVSATVTPPVSSSTGTLSTGFNYTQLVSCGITIASGEKGDLLIFTDANLEQIQGVVSIDTGGGGDGSGGGGSGE